MINQYKCYIIGAIVILAGTFAAGRYSVTTTPATKVDTSLQTQQQVDKNTHTVTVEVKEPSGEVKRTTTTDTTTVATKETESKIKTEVVPPKRSTLNVSLLGGYYFPDFLPVYGISISKEVLGPVTVGAFGLSNGTIGVSVGLDF